MPLADDCLGPIVLKNSVATFTAASWRKSTSQIDPGSTIAAQGYWPTADNASSICMCLSFVERSLKGSELQAAHHVYRNLMVAAGVGRIGRRRLEKLNLYVRSLGVESLHVVANVLCALSHKLIVSARWRFKGNRVADVQPGSRSPISPATRHHRCGGKLEFCLLIKR